MFQPTLTKYDNHKPSEHNNKCFEVTCFNGDTLIEHGVSENDVRLTVKYKYPQLNVTFVEQLNW